MIWTVAKKELRGYFNSAVAVIFLAAFLVATMYFFFWHEKFFARGLADLRPLFEWMPRLIIILVSALAMRLWADERRAGTLEVLLTLPVPRWKLVLGKFAAGMLLIAIALGLTLGLPITVGMMGNLDTGPVIGGYLAALLLSAAYLSIGMCVSAATDNQIVAFVGTALVCAAAYAIGEIGDGTSGLAHALGTGARFDSVARGVLDLRDLAYYLAITASCIALNVLLLGVRTWGRGKRARGRRIGTVLAVALVAANALALNLWLAPVGRARVDLTQDRLYSLSPSTKKILRSLDERLLVRAYLSERLHPLLAPLAPQIKDLLEEYRVSGGGKVRVEIVDPSDSKEAKAEAKEKYNIEAIQLPFASETEKSVITMYFSIVVEYGDQHEVLGIQQLLQVRSRDIDDVEVKLRNFEYGVTSSIKKVVSAFSSLDSMFAAAPGPVRLIAYMTPKTLPKEVAEVPAKLKKVADELAKDSGGKLAYSVVEPRFATSPKDPAARKEAEDLLQRHGAQPQRADILSDKIFYYHLVLELRDRPIVVPLALEDLGEAAIRTAITDAFKRASPGFRKVVGLWSPPAGAPQFVGQDLPPQQLPPAQEFRNLQRSLGESYEVQPVGLEARVPDRVDVLLLAGPAKLDAKAAEHVDQFVMRGGALVVLGGRFRPPFGGGRSLEKVETGLEGLFDKWGIKIAEDMVVDPENEALLRPVERELGNGLVVQELEARPHGLLVRVTGDRIQSSSIITSGLPGAVIAFGSPVSAEAKVGGDEREVEVLLRSSAGSWLTKSPDAVTDPDKYPGVGFPAPASDGERGSQTLAVAISGGFASGIAKPAEQAEGSGSGAGPAAPQMTAHSPPNTRIVVFGSSSFVSDEIVELARQLNSDLVGANLQLVQNAIDWAVSDTDLLAIRARTTAARAITVEPDARDGWRWANLIIAALALAGVVALAYLRRRAVTPFVTAKEV